MVSKETLEEAAEKWLNKDGFNFYNHYDTRPSFIAGAKWQQEQDKNKYSEELIQLEILINSQEELKDKGVLNNEGIGYLNGLKTALKQFKKK